MGTLIHGLRPLLVELLRDRASVPDAVPERRDLHAGALSGRHDVHAIAVAERIGNTDPAAVDHPAADATAATDAAATDEETMRGRA